MGEAWARHGDLRSVSPPEARRIAEEVRAPWRRGGPVMAATREMTRPVRTRIHDPGGAAPKPALIYLHGGGWTLFSIDTHDRVMREYAARAGVVVAGIDYALAPEAKYPIALNQVVAMVRHLARHGEETGIDRDRIAIGGDSAGANLALAAALSLRDEKLIRGIVLNYGVFARHPSPEAVKRAEGSVLTAEEMEWFWTNYLREPGDADDPLVCPVHADLRGLPPVLLVVAEHDLLSEQSMKLAELLRAGGVAVQVAIYRGTTHSFLEAISISPLAEQAFNDTAAWLRATLSE